MATPQQLEEAIRRADAAGDADSVRALGAELMRQRRSTAKPTSFWQGAAEEVVKASHNVQDFADMINPFSHLARAVGLDSDKNKQAIRAKEAQVFARSPNQGSTLGRIAGGVAATAPTLAIPGGVMAQGAVGGAMLTDKRGSGVLGDMALGAIGAKAGDLVGKYVISPVAKRISGAIPQNVSKYLGPLLSAPRVSKGEATVIKNAAPRSMKEKAFRRPSAAEAEVRANLQDAQRLGLPYGLGDASPQLRTVSGSVARKSIDARKIAEETLGPRALGQADRATAAIQNNLAPITNIEQRSAALKKKAWEEAQPFYKAAYAHPAPNNPELAQMLNSPAGKEALKDAYTIAQNRGMNPNELGFIMDDTGAVGLQSDAGRYVPAKLGNARDALQGGSPEDLVTWLRRNGGLADHGGELRHMGIGNKPRSGMVGGLETKIGPLVNERGMNFDDAALGAWEAGYFPELTDRPSINTFLDAVRGTHEGINRRFLPEDLARLENFDAASAERAALQKIKHDTGNSAVFDTSVPAGPDAPFAPMSARGEKEVQLPTMETMDLVKQALDGKLQSFRNPISGKLDLEGNKVAGSVNDLLQRLKANLDEGNIDYRQARGMYADAIKPRGALDLGYRELPKSSIPQRQFDAALAGMNKEMLPEAQRGYATALADQVERVRLSGNPYDAIYGSTLQRGKVKGLFPEGAPRLERTYNLEKDMAKTANETLGGSPTQARNMADQQFDAGMIAPLADVALGGGGLISMARNGARSVADAYRVGLGRARADEMAPMLFNTDPQAAQAILDEILRKQAEQEAQRRAWGALVGRGAAVAPFLGGGSP